MVHESAEYGAGQYAHVWTGAAVAAEHWGIQLRAVVCHHAAVVDHDAVELLSAQLADAAVEYSGESQS